MFIQTEVTPNPNALKFFPGMVLCEGAPSQWTRASDDLSLAPLARDLLAMDAVVEVLIAHDYVSVRKIEDASWTSLKILILGTIADFMEFGWPMLADEAQLEGANAGERGGPSERGIIDILDTHVRPAVARDGGDVRLHHYDSASKTAWIELRGACGRCPSARITLKQGIERVLTEHLPFVHQVEEFQSPDAAGPETRKQFFRDLAARGGGGRPQTRFSFNGKPLTSFSA